jgi:hypothetical protein
MKNNKQINPIYPVSSKCPFDSDRTYNSQNEVVKAFNQHYVVKYSNIVLDGGIITSTSKTKLKDHDFVELPFRRTKIGDRFAN